MKTAEEINGRVGYIKITDIARQYLYVCVYVYCMYVCMFMHVCMCMYALCMDLYIC